MTEKTTGGFIDELLSRYPVSVLKALLRDKTTKKNIVWADNEYSYLGHGFHADDEITVEKITGRGNKTIRPRIEKDEDRQSLRTKAHAEVFTPSWLCCRMNNDIDEQWFGVADIFNHLQGHEWEPSKAVIEFGTLNWKRYVDNRRLEITCGEAPFICSRYDTVSGEKLPVNARIGFLDRKLRVVSENTEDYETWLKWAYRALESTYGYEYQGDNLLVARINVLETFTENMQSRWNKSPDLQEVFRATTIISWNIWQMDGFTSAVSGSLPAEQFGQLDLFEIINNSVIRESPLCRIYDWSSKHSLLYANLKNKRSSRMKKFYAIVGNPPYQQQTDSDSTRMPPIYDFFMNESFEIADKVELITPARFLFDAGYTPHEWNKKMLNDPHFKVLDYESSSEEVFPGTDIKGGVAVTYRDSGKNFGPIVIFTKYSELNTILKKITSRTNEYLNAVITSPLNYQLTGIGAKQAGINRLRSNAFTVLPDLFYGDQPEDGHDYVALIGLADNKKRAKRYIKREYLTDKNGVLDYWKVLLPKSNGTGAFGEALASMYIAAPGVGHLQTFISIGSYESESSAQNTEKYIKTKFVRALLGILKVTQDNPAPKWKYVPIQDFTDKSDIDWSKSIAEIDQQLYKKYDLSDDEIDFIETHVKEMN